MPGRNVVAALTAQVGLDATRYERGAQRLNRANREVYREQQRIRREQARLTREFNNSLSAMRNSALALTAMGAAFVAGVRRIADMGDQLGKMSERLNISIGQLQSLQLAAESVGIPFDKAASSIQTLQVRFARLGLETSSFRTELRALNPELLAQLDSVDSTAEAYRIYVERIRDLQREGRDLEALQLAQAGVGQGGAQGFLQVQAQEEQSRRTLIEAGVLLSDEDRRVFADISQDFTDLGSVIKNTLLVALVEFATEIRGLIGFVKELLSGFVPLTAAVAAGAAVFGGLARLGVGLLSTAGAALALIRSRLRTAGIRGLFGGAAGGTLAGFGANALITGATIAGAGVGLDQFLDLQGGLSDRSLIQRGALDTDADTRARLRRFQQGGSGGSPLDSREQLFRLAYAVYGEDGLREILENAGLDESQRPADTAFRRFINRGRGFEIDPNYDAELARLNRRFDRRQNARVGQALRGTANVLFPPEFAVPVAPDRVDPAVAAEAERLREFYESRITSGVRGRDLGADFDLAPLRLAQEDFRAERRRLREFYESRIVSRPVGGRDLGADLSLGGLGGAFAERDVNRLRELEHRRRIHQDLLELAAEYTEELDRSRDVAKTLTNAIKGSETAFRAAFVDSILEGKLQLEDFGNILRRITAQLIDALAIQPLVSAGQSFFQQFINGFIGGGGFGGGSNPVVNPGPGGPAGYNVPPVAAATAPPLFAPAATTAPTVNIVVNGVEDRAAFERVASRVEQTIVPTVANRLAATANRPGAARQIRGY